MQGVPSLVGDEEKHLTSFLQAVVRSSVLRMASRVGLSSSATGLKFETAPVKDSKTVTKHAVLSVSRLERQVDLEILLCRCGVAKKLCNSCT